MKRLLSLIMLLTLSCLLFAFTFNPSAGFISVKGYADEKAWVDVRPYTSVSNAFDILGDKVAPVSDYSSAPGLPVGNWTMFSTTDRVKVSFNVTPLQLYDEASGTVAEGHDINYYLQVTYPKKFYTSHDRYTLANGLWPVYSDSTTKSLVLSADRTMKNNFYIVNGENLYLRLATPQEEISVDTQKYPNGLYRSTITVSVTVIE
ncbi:MAG: hypothetical protein IJ831_02475 [Spirochaetales bacterium]|nr:hypothetical protein [Spirochaetales bacterium]